MASQLIAIEDFATFRAAAERARDLSSRFKSSASIRRTPTGWAILVSDAVARQLGQSRPANRPTQVHGHLPQVFEREISERQLLVLKAFYMGHAIAEKIAVRASAIQMIDAAIEHLHESESPHWLAFYLMMRAEIDRHDGEPPVELRARIRDIDGDMYDMFMLVEQATQRRRKLDGIQTLAIVDPGIERTESHVVTNGWESWVVRYDIACRALGISERDISADQREFLSRTTLKELLHSHGVAFAP